MRYFQVNIGRNIGTRPMDERTWETFKTQISWALTERTGNGLYVQVHTGIGQWDGVEEESAHISVLTDRDVDVNGLKQDLTELAGIFRQDAIAFIEGSELIGGVS